MTNPEAKIPWRERPPENIYDADGSYTQEFAHRMLDERVYQVSGNAEMIAKARGWKTAARLPGQPESMTIIHREDVDVKDESINHPNSDARYIIDYFRFKAPDGKECMMFLWGMEAGQETSKRPHVHSTGIDGNGIYEHHFVIAGSIEVNGHILSTNRDNDGVTHNYHKALPGQTHAAKAGEKGAVVAIILENVEGIPNNKIHEYLEGTVIDRAEHILRQEPAVLSG